MIKNHPDIHDMTFNNKYSNATRLIRTSTVKFQLCDSTQGVSVFSCSQQKFIFSFVSDVQNCPSANDY